MPEMAVRPSAPMKICSSWAFLRNSGATALPIITPTVTIAIAMPTSAVPASFVFSQNASKKKQNPTEARSSAIALAARMIPADFSSTFSSRVAFLAATTSRGSRNAKTNAITKKIAPATSAPSTPNTALANPATAAPPKPNTPAMSPSLELASTRSASLRTTEGTSADFEMLCVFCSTSAANEIG